jgi:hypothetical protein
MKPELPPLDLGPKKRPNLRAIRPPDGADDATVEANSQRLINDWGGMTSVQQKVPMASLRLEVPEYIDRLLAQRAFEQRTTKQYLVLKALKDAGYPIDDADLVPDKRRRRGGR